MTNDDEPVVEVIRAAGGEALQALARDAVRAVAELGPAFQRAALEWWARASGELPEGATHVERATAQFRATRASLEEHAGWRAACETAIRLATAAIEGAVAGAAASITERLAP